MENQVVKTTADMMASLQSDIEDVRNGKISESLARVVFTGRKLQIKTAELQLQYRRLVRSKATDSDGGTPLLMTVG